MFVTYYNRNTVDTKGTENLEESLTDQSFKFDSDINDLVYRYSSGLAPRTPIKEPQYDIENYATASMTFEDWQNEKAKIERKFLHLTPDMRAKFGTPQEFFKYCSNPENYEITDKGLKEKPKEDFIQPLPSGEVPEVQKPLEGETVK